MLVSLGAVNVLAQEVVVADSTGVVKNSEVYTERVEKKRDSAKPFTRFKAEGVISVVGDYVILDSDIDKAYLEMKQSRGSVDDINRCQMLGKLMEDKLYLHQAEVDSLTVNEAQVSARVDQQLQYIIGEIGSEEKVLQFYRKNSLPELRQELYDNVKEIELTGMMQGKVVENVEVTPEEVREFFFSIPEEDRPVIGAEVEVAQIVIEPEISAESRQDVIDRLNEMRLDVVENGASFSSKAVLYSKDPGSSSKGGMIKAVTRTSPLAKEFKDQAFSLLEGEVSQPFETEFGFHILYVDKIRGQEVDVRHILLFPDVSQSAIDKAREEIETIRQRIVDGEITFAEAARASSDEVETRNNGGQLVNPVSFDTRFDLTKMEPTLSAQVYNLEKGEVSSILSDQDYTGKRKFKILTVTDRYEEHQAEFKKDYEKIKELALKEKQIRVIEEWQDKKIMETYVNVNEDYVDCNFASNWLKK
jgi:peptidyl-prolyl cis-trans isomerase SurA